MVALLLAGISLERVLVDTGCEDPGERGSGPALKQIPSVDARRRGRPCIAIPLHRPERDEPRQRSVKAGSPPGHREHDRPLDVPLRRDRMAIAIDAVVGADEGDERAEVAPAGPR